jgi:hypothetical protein
MSTTRRKRTSKKEQRVPDVADYDWSASRVATQRPLKQVIKEARQREARRVKSGHRPRRQLTATLTQLEKHAHDKRGNKVRGWSAMKPVSATGSARQRLWRDCGQQCFVGKPYRDPRSGKMKYPFPICATCPSGGKCNCSIQPSGARAAYMRARSVASRMRNQGRASDATHYEAIASRAKSLLAKDRWGGANLQVPIHSDAYKTLKGLIKNQNITRDVFVLLLDRDE